MFEYGTVSTGVPPQGLSVPWGILRGVRKFRSAQQRDGCAVGCPHGRADDGRLPWATEGAYGGWGGHEHHGTDADSDRRPVVFAHGNQRDACDWEPHAEFFLERGYTGNDLWAITFREGTPTHESMAEQLDAFVGEIREHTGADAVDVVGHSLAVTGLRYWLATRGRFEWVDTFVGLAGANHGTVLSTWCVETGLQRGPYGSNRFLRADYDEIPDHPLASLNTDETPGDIDYYTIRGTDDTIFWRCHDSPVLDGATNLALETDHDGVRADLRAIEHIFEWVSGTHPYNVQHQVAAPK
jgi:pimeloyl-ACP methyl ester carboxylesterase